MRNLSSSFKMQDPCERHRVNSILRFQVPMGLTALMMASGFSIINAGLARTLHPETALAAFALGQTVTNMFGSPVWSARQMLLAFSTDRDSMNAAVRVAVSVAALVMIWIALLGYTPLGRFVYVDIFGASDDLFPEVLSVVRICIFLPLVHLIRAWPQSILMRREQTILMTHAMVIRMAGMLAMALYMPGLGYLEGASLGAFIWIAGMGIEGIMCLIFALPRFPEVYGVVLPEGESASTTGDCLRFLLPIIAQGLLMTFSLPAVNAGLARTISPERNLAVFQVSWSIAFMFLAFIMVNLSQTVLVLLRDVAWWRSLRRVGVTLSAAISALMIAFVLSGASEWILREIIEVNPALLPATKVVLLLMASAPYLSGLVELKTGIALRRGTTAIVGMGKALDLAAVAAVVFGLSAIFPHLGAAVGPIAFGCGLALNYLFLRARIPEPDADFAVTAPRSHGT